MIRLHYAWYFFYRIQILFLPNSNTLFTEFNTLFAESLKQFFFVDKSRKIKSYPLRLSVGSYMGNVWSLQNLVFGYLILSLSPGHKVVAATRAASTRNGTGRGLPALPQVEWTVGDKNIEFGEKSIEFGKKSI